MAQVIQVNFMNPEDGENITEPQFTKASSHHEAIELALGIFGVPIGLIQMESLGKGDFIRAATNSWRYAYRCLLKLPEEYGNREVTVVLFATYREKAEQGQPFDTYITRDGKLVKQEYRNGEEENE